MTRPTPTLLLLSLLPLSAPALAADGEAHRVTLETTSEGTVGHCEAEVSRRLEVCARDGKCRRVPLDDETRFAVPLGGSFAITASVSYVENGVIYGDATTDRVTELRDGARLVQTLSTGAMANGTQCSRVWSYEVRVD